MKKKIDVLQKANRKDRCPTGTGTHKAPSAIVAANAKEDKTI
jgi:hypothetical protein